jgi:hypothetical protein
VENVSTTYFSLSATAPAYNIIVIVSSSGWPSWLPAMALWLGHQSARELVVKVFVPHKSWTNIFSTARDPRFQWHSMDICHPYNFPHVCHILRETMLPSHNTLYLYDGSFSGLSSFGAVIDSTKHDVVAIVPGSVRLNSLKLLSSFSWRRMNHRDVGGCTNGTYWMGSSGGINHNYVAYRTAPLYCPSSLKDILTFAPKEVSVVPVSIDSIQPNPRKAAVVLQWANDPQVVFDHGLAPVLATCTGPFKVITRSPFSPTRWAIRAITLKELGLMLDLPNTPIWRLCALKYGNTAFKEGNVELFSAIPVNILCHALWNTGIYDAHGKVVHLNDHLGGGGTLLQESFQTKTNTESSFSSQLVSANEFGSNATRVDVQAVKHDDAEVPVYLWNDRLINTGPQKWRVIPRNRINKALDGFRVLGLIVWKKNIYKSFIRYLMKNWYSEWMSIKNGEVVSNKMSSIEFHRDVTAAIDCMHYTSRSTWWEWNQGSRLLFWRWNWEYKKQARDGMQMLWIPDKLASSRKEQAVVKDKITKALMASKLSKVINRGYIKRGNVRSLIKYFSVPKGSDDVRMVYDGTASGFNDSIWVPNFGLPTIDTLIRGTGPTTWMVDLDIGDMFLNFMLHWEARPFVGIDISKIFPERLSPGARCLWLQWYRCAMGLKSSPYQAICAVLIAEEFMKGHYNDINNPFHYNHVRLNLPGSDEYSTALPWFSIIDSFGELAAILAIYVDDERIHHSTEEGAWLAARQVATRESYLGIQDAARKRRPPSQNAGAWAGSILRTNQNEVGRSVSQERWTKARSIICKWKDKVTKDPNVLLEVKELMSDRGYLNYIARTYPTITTFLKGFHLTIDGWRRDRDKEGWKEDNFMYHPDIPNTPSPDYPMFVLPARRFLDDLKILAQLTNFIEPPILKIRSKNLVVAKYTFGDASGAGFATSTITVGESNLSVLYGTWNERMNENSSNFKEFGNFVMHLKQAVHSGDLDGAEVFMFTDNSTTEAAWFNGTSKSKLLFNLVVELKLLELTHGVKFHLIHVAGTRMISQGTDGISRGMLMEGVLVGEAMSSFIPINKGAHLRSEHLVGWLYNCTFPIKLIPLTEKQWLWEGHGLSSEMWTNCDGMKFPVRNTHQDTYLWCPAPVVAAVALEELRKSRHKRPDLTHIFVCPKLMTPLWRKHLLRTCCLSFYVDPGLSHWPDSMHESLLIGIYLPYLPCYPWTFRRSKSVLEVERQLRLMPKVQGGSQSFVLRQFFAFTRKLPTMSEDVVRSMLSQGCIR